MTSLFKSLAPATLAGLSFATPASAEAAQATASPPAPATQCRACVFVHHGFYLEASFGFAWLMVQGDGPSGSASISAFGTSTSVAVGGTILPGLALAGTIRAANGTATFHGGPFEHANIVSSVGSPLASANGDADVTFVQIGVLVDWYPNARGGWHLGGAVGPGGTVVTPLANGADMSNATFAGTIFGGYETWIAPQWTIGFVLVASGATRATLKDSDANDAGYRLQPLAISLESSILFY